MSSTLLEYANALDLCPSMSNTDQTSWIYLGFLYFILVYMPHSNRDYVCSSHDESFNLLAGVRTKWDQALGKYVSLTH